MPVKERVHVGKMNDWLEIPQPRLGAVGLLVLLVLGSLTAPLSLDMYTPSIPNMSNYFNTTDDVVNLTLVGYYLFMAVGLLIFGPLSDKFGRKPVLLAGLACYCLSSLACAASVSIWMLIGARVVEALSSGAMSAVCTAVVKDAIKPAYRERMLAIIQIIFVIGPVAAPIIGAGILVVANWRGVFIVLAAVSALEFLMALAFKETLPAQGRATTSLPATLARLGHVAKNRAFLFFLLITSAWEIGYMAYVSVGSYIYIDFFGFSALGFSLFFATVALTNALGPAAWLKISKNVTHRFFTSLAIVCTIVVGILILLVGRSSAFVFCGLFLVFAFFESAVRPYAVNILLAQQDSDIGSASALINCTRVFLGAVGMFLVLLPVFGTYVEATGWMIVAPMTIALAGWVALLRSRHVVRGL